MSDGVIVDVRRATTSPHTGIGKYAHELQSRLERVVPDAGVTWFEQPPPQHRFLSVNASRRLGRVTTDSWSTLRASRGAALWHMVYPESLVSCPFVASVHDLTVLDGGRRQPLSRRYYAAMTVRAISKARTVMCISGGVRDEIAQRFGREDEVEVIPLGIDDGLLAAPARVTRPEGPEFVLYFGGFAPRKRVDGLLGAWESIYRRTGLVLKMVGGLGRVQEQVGVQLLPQLARSELNQLIQSSAFTVYPSDAEGFGLPIVESIAAGVPIVCRDSGIVGELPDEAVIAAGPDDDDLTNAIYRAVDGWVPAPEAVRDVRRRYDWDEVARTTVEVYRRWT